MPSARMVSFNTATCRQIPIRPMQCAGTHRHGDGRCSFSFGARLIPRTDASLIQPSTSRHYTRFVHGRNGSEDVVFLFVIYSPKRDAYCAIPSLDWHGYDLVYQPGSMSHGYGRLHKHASHLRHAEQRNAPVCARKVALPWPRAETITSRRTVSSRMRPLAVRRLISWLMTRRANAWCS